MDWKQFQQQIICQLGDLQESPREEADPSLRYVQQMEYLREKVGVFLLLALEQMRQ